MKQKLLSTTQVIMLSFLITIVIGSLLLSLPISSATGNAVNYLDALFTSTTATCVTGLVTLPVVTTWSVFGQVVILILIQIGGLGVVTVMSGIMISLHKKLGLSDRVLLQDAFNLNSLSGLVKFTKKVIIGSFIIELLGAAMYMSVFVPQFGAKGIWISVFNAVSAFCNAGIDIVSKSSLCEYSLNPIINFTTIALIVLGGLGYVVWWDIGKAIKSFKKYKFRVVNGLTLHSKIVLFSTIILIVIGALLILIFEYNNPLTIGNLSLPQKLQAAVFQSVTTRTAGFATIEQQNFTNASALVSILLMFIGGSPIGTAGGIKTVTIVVLVASVISTIKNKNETVLFNRTISKKLVDKAVAVTGMSFFIVTVSTILLACVTDANMLDIVYETVSATATVGLTRNLTSSFNALAKLIIIITMYLGRVGPISLAIAFKIRKTSTNIIKNPIEEVSVG